MVEEHSRALDLDRITSKLMLSPGSKNNSSKGKIERSIRVKKGLNPLKIRCFISCQKKKRILHLHEKKFSDLDNFQANTAMFQTNTNASLKNLEVEIGQLAQAVQKKPKDCMVGILRSNRELDERRSEKKGH